MNDGLMATQLPPLKIIVNQSNYRTLLLCTLVLNQISLDPIDI